MPIVLYRIDERLIHGQVVIGWGHALRPDRYLIVDDELAESEWEQELYRLAAGDTEVVFVTCQGGMDLVDEWRREKDRSILLTRDIATMRRFGEGGRLRGERLNLGGLHHGPGRVEVLTYLHLSREDREALQELAADGAEISAKDLPDARGVALGILLKRPLPEGGDGNS